METTISSGTLRGSEQDGVAVFRAVPYATAERFHAPEPVRPWPGVRDATRPGAAAPQAIGGPPVVPAWPDPVFDEAQCLNLSVYRPTAPGGPRPVLLWIHGGGFLTGSANLPCYDATELARAGDIVVVTINYRLGALGYLDVSGGNFGLLDQIAALRWVHENIAEFGGDPGAITVGGQSAGAMSTHLLMANEDSAPLFHRVFLQSAPLGLLPATAEQAALSTQRLTEALGEDPGTAPWQRIAEVQTTLRGVAMVPPPFIPVLGGNGLPKLPEEVDLSRFQVMIGTTADEHTFFGGPRGDSPLFEPGKLALAQRQTEAGSPAYVYKFDWAGAAPWYATHCVDLPFLFGNAPVWDTSAALAGSTAQQRQPLTEQFQRAVSGFVRTGDPGTDWSPYPAVRHFSHSA
ncbi:carboxylesterase family protein [Kutzneria viridogrisea]|uniref:Carboxylic ester hydrolase n=1 Tax=Kutzneria viridogrisea TaxID=47990 RepID=A0ABR6BW76_9PSEU|nr:para-nitrobenzyl esterase [Kutzneria viridogrisea]